MSENLFNLTYNKGDVYTISLRCHFLPIRLEIATGFATHSTGETVYWDNRTGMKNDATPMERNLAISSKITYAISL